MRDISERQANEKALRANERKYRNLYQEFQTLLNGITDLLILLKPDATIAWHNSAVSRLTPLDVEDLVGEDVSMLFESEKDWCHDKIVQAFAEGTKIEFINDTSEL